MIEEILMGLGAAIWIVGELLAASKRHDPDTTTSYVRRFASRWVLVRIGVALFTSWLWIHFNLGWL